MTKESFPSLSLVDPASSDDIRSITISDTKDSIWAMLVTYGSDNRPTFVVSIDISQANDKSVQKIDVKYYKIQELKVDPILYAYNLYMYQYVAGNNDGIKFNEKDMILLPIEEDEEFSLAVDIFSDRNSVAVNKLFSETSRLASGPSSLYDTYIRSIKVDNGLIKCLDRDQLAIYQITVSRYKSNMFTNEFVLTRDNIKEFSTYRPVLCQYIIDIYGKKAKKLYDSSAKEQKMPKLLGNIAGIATSALGMVTAGATHWGNRNIASDVAGAVENIFTVPKVDKVDKFGPVLDNSKVLQTDRKHNEEEGFTYKRDNSQNIGDIKVSKIINI